MPVSLGQWRSKYATGKWIEIAGVWQAGKESLRQPKWPWTQVQKYTAAVAGNDGLCTGADRGASLGRGIDSCAETAPALPPDSRVVQPGLRATVRWPSRPRTPPRVVRNAMPVMRGGGTENPEP